MLDLLHPTVARWSTTALGKPSPPQRLGWPRIHAGEHVLIAAPTGSGKTLTACQWRSTACCARANAFPTRRRSSTSRR